MAIANFDGLGGSLCSAKCLTDGESLLCPNITGLCDDSGRDLARGSPLTLEAYGDFSMLSWSNDALPLTEAFESGLASELGITSDNVELTNILFQSMR